MEAAQSIRTRDNVAFIVLEIKMLLNLKLPKLLTRTPQLDAYKLTTLSLTLIANAVLLQIFRSSQTTVPTDHTSSTKQIFEFPTMCFN